MSELEKDYKYIREINAKCTWRLILLHVAEKTLEDSEYTFSSVDISEAFGCSREAASHLLSRQVGYGMYTKVDTHGYRPFLYKITKAGMKRAERLMMDGANNVS